MINVEFYVRDKNLNKSRTISIESFLSNINDIYIKTITIQDNLEEKIIISYQDKKEIINDLSLYTIDFLYKKIPSCINAIKKYYRDDFNYSEKYY